MSNFRRRIMMASGKIEKTYIQFADPNAQKYCAEKWGDGIGITQRQAESVLSFLNYQFDSKEIKSFDELKYFSSVKIIPQYFISNNPITRVTIPINVTNIQNYWFRNNQGNKNVAILLLPIDPPKLEWASLNGIPADCKFYVPDESVNVYKSAEIWNGRSNYIFPISEYVE